MTGKRKAELISAIKEAHRMANHWAAKAEINRPKGFLGKLVPFRLGIYKEYSRRAEANIKIAERLQIELDSM